jgi:hypothetical protein
MKSFKILALPAFLLFTATACDYVQVPQQTGNNGGGGGPQDTAVRKVLLEDYTGHFCPNCPRAAEAIDTMHHLFGDNVIPISIHAGDFAKPAAQYGLPWGAPSNSFPEDFRTPEGNEWNTTFGLFAYPLGMINRTPDPATTNLLSLYNEWPTLISQELTKAPTAYLKLTPNYNAGTRTLNLTINGTILVDTAGTFLIKTVLVEDSIYEWQIDGALAPADTWIQYYHNHMLRTSIDNPGSGGGDTAITGTAITANSTFTRNYTNINISNAYNDNHCRIVTFIYDVTNNQILQAEEVDLR